MNAAHRMYCVINCAGLVAGCAGGPQIKQGCARPNYATAIIGDLAGGSLGSQIGAGLGRDLAIAAGAGSGAIVGSKVDCN